MRCEVLERHYHSHIKDDLWGLVNTETKVLFSKESEEFLEHLRDCPILKKDQFKTVLIVCCVCVCVQRATLRTRTRLTATQTTTRLVKMRPSCAASSNGSCRGIVRPSPMSRSRASRKVMVPQLFVRPPLHFLQPNRTFGSFLSEFGVVSFEN